jgi:predicted RecB family nuclease
MGAMTWTLPADAAATCPVKVRHAFTPESILPPPPPLHPYAAAARATAARLLDEFVAAQPVGSLIDLRPLSHTSQSRREQACLRAMDAGSAVIVGATLPSDTIGHRRGTASILVRGPNAADGGPGYLPIQVHGHRLLEARPQHRLLISRFTAPAVPHHLDGVDFRDSRLGDRLELVHLWHMLDAVGHAVAGVRRGGLIGPDRRGVIAWAPLDHPRVPPNPRGSGSQHLVSPVQRYAEEFALREGVARAAMAGEPTEVDPIRIRECEVCPWWPVCRPMLDDDDLSLRIEKGPLDVYEIQALRSLGIWTTSDLATADAETLLPLYLELVAHRSDAEQRLNAATHRAHLLQEGIELERTRQGPISVPSAPVEIDLDVEASSDNRVYLWGFLVHDPAAGEPYYHAFAEFADLDDAAEAELALRALTWLRDLVTATGAKVFHYSDYELVRIAHVAKTTPALDWAPCFARRHFVDLFPLVRDQFFGVHGLGLKNVAHVGAGFEWRDPEPGGLNSQTWFHTAVHGPAPSRAAARARVLAYNEDDVRATWHLRRWMRDLT